MSLQDLLIEQRGPSSDKKGRGGATVKPVVKPPQRVNKPRQTTTEPTQTTPTQTTPDEQQGKELEIYFNNFEFFSPNGVRIENFTLNDILKEKVKKNYESWKTVNPTITLLQALVLTLIRDKGYNISSFNAPKSYQEQLDKLISENLISKVKGLRNILLEQFERVSYVVKNGKIQKPSSQTKEQPSTAGKPTGPLVPPKTSAVPTPKPEPKPEPKPDEGEKTTTTQSLSNNQNIKKIKYYSNLIKTTETPSYKLCDNLFDNYESNVKLLKKQIEQGLIEPPKGDEPELVDIKKKLKWCYTSSEEKWRFRFKFSQLSSMRDEEIKDENGKEIDNPFKVNI